MNRNASGNWRTLLGVLSLTVIFLGSAAHAGAFPGKSPKKSKEKLKFSEVYEDGRLSVYEGEEITLAPTVTSGTPEDISTPVARPPRTGDGPNPLPGPGSVLAPGDEEKDRIKEIERIINLGERIWKIIVANKPVVDAPTKSASALPNVVKSGFELENWSLPRARSYRITYTNWYGITVVDYAFRVAYTYGGSLDNVGKYLNNISVVPANLEVAWGYTFKSEVEVADPVNLGTKTNPEAGLELRVIWKVDTPIKHQTRSLGFFFEGDGTLKVLD